MVTIFFLKTFKYHLQYEKKKEFSLAKNLVLPYFFP